MMGSPPVLAGTQLHDVGEDAREVRCVVVAEIRRDVLELAVGLGQKARPRADPEPRRVLLHRQAHLVAEHVGQTIDGQPNGACHLGQRDRLAVVIGQVFEGARGVVADVERHDGVTPAPGHRLQDRARPAWLDRRYRSVPAHGHGGTGALRCASGALLAVRRPAGFDQPKLRRGAERVLLRVRPELSGYQVLSFGPAGSSPATRLANIKAYLAAGFPSMFGFPVYREYDNPLPGGLIAYPTTGYRGGHANVVAGYDDNLMIGSDKGALLIRNSWGTSWANAGYAWMTY